jgi:hypothetical protein
MGQRKSVIEIASLARAHTETVIKVLAGIVTREDVSPTARIAAGQALLDRGWGKPTQSVKLNDERRSWEIVNEIIDPETREVVELVVERDGEMISLPPPSRESEPGADDNDAAPPEREPETSEG